MSDLFINFAAFNDVEHRILAEQNMDNQEILNRAVAALNSNLYREKATIDYSGDVPYLNLMGKRFWCVVKPNLTLGDMVGKSHPIDKEARILYVTINATPKMLELAKLPDINVLDCAGNFNIQYQQKNGNVVLLLANKGEKAIAENIPKAYPIFLEKGLKVIFYLLLDKENISRTYRDIMDATGVSIGTVKNIIDGMIYQQFARVEGNKRFLTNTNRLMMLWATNYGQILKPKLLQSRFTFRDEEKRRNWKAMTLPDGMMWGGEPAAALTDGFLTPGEFTIYTDVPAAILMKTGAAIPDANGEITVYQKFWKDEEATNVTPAILTYADLMDTANSRCIEAAQKIKDNELKYLL
ncbi:MAG: type IV toxin-antitoxin system AbiEi family antitoxin [Muribaculum sp.]|nr:type IV toxin-antitoxin system AbiEi family antitoxin [Muribaculum sp.]